MNDIMLTRKQLVELVDEARKLRDWVTVKDFCDQAYGEDKVVSFDIETYGEYDDEGGTTYYIQSVTAEDGSGAEIPFDLELPFWQLVLKDVKLDEASSEEEKQELALDYVKDWYGKSEMESWVQWQELPCDDKDSDRNFDLLQRPKISLLN